jgi:hypothetical protein
VKIYFSPGMALHFGMTQNIFFGSPGVSGVLVSKEKKMLFCYYLGHFSGVYRCSPGL